MMVNVQLPRSKHLEFRVFKIVDLPPIRHIILYIKQEYTILSPNNCGKVTSLTKIL